jgi:hippurate hydrolase
MLQSSGSLALILLNILKGSITFFKKYTLSPMTLIKKDTSSHRPLDPSFDTNLYERMVSLRRELHRHPELSGKEEFTATRICQFLQNLGISYRMELAKTGVIANIPGPPNIPCVVLRADTDALPIQEETNLPFSSTQEGVMHACGHDGHTAMLLGAAELLARETTLPAPVRFLFQPAEETASGASRMIEEGLLENAGMIFGGHLDRHYQPGFIAVTEGPVNASADNFSIHITGQGGHGARPHESIDAVVVASLMVMALQTIVSREVDPARPSVVSVGLLRAGTAPNVIAGQASLAGTIRAQHQEVRQHLHAAIKRMATSIAQLHGAKVEVAFTMGAPPVINSREMTMLATEAATQTVGKNNVCPLKTANMGGEDFSFYLEKIPGAYVRFGGQVEGRESYPAHSSRFDFDERALAVGASYYYHMAKIAGTYLRNQITHSQDGEGTHEHH